MEYITHHDFEGKSISGEISFHRGDILDCINGMLYKNGEKICVARSQNGKEHFSRNDDGNGLERGDITYSLAFGERERTWTEEVIHTDADTGEEIIEVVECHGRFTPDEIYIIEHEYTQFDRNPNGVLLFSDEFFSSDIETLRELMSRLDAT